MPSLDEVFHYLRGIWLLVRNDPSGMNYLDITTRGFWRSFWAYVFAIPAYAVQWVSTRNAILRAEPDTNVGLGFIIREIGAEIMVTALFLIAVALVSHSLKFSHRYAHWLIAGNWLGLAILYVFVIPIALAELTGQYEVFSILQLIIGLFAIVASFRVYRLTLQGDTMLAAGILTAQYIWSILAMFLLL